MNKYREEIVVNKRDNKTYIMTKPNKENAKQKTKYRQIHDKFTKHKTNKEE